MADTNKGAGPALYTEELAEEICRRMADGQSLRRICRDAHIPDERTIRGWAIDDVCGFAARYARARELQVFRWAEDIVEIADDASQDWVETEKGPQANNERITRSKLRIDVRKWLLSKILPKQFGDKLNGAGDPEASLTVTRKIYKAGDGSAE